MMRLIMRSRSGFHERRRDEESHVLSVQHTRHRARCCPSSPRGWLEGGSQLWAVPCLWESPHQHQASLSVLQFPAQTLSTQDWKTRLARS